VDNIFQKLTCIDASDVGLVKKDEIYYGIELSHVYEIYSEPSKKDKNGRCAKIGVYVKNRFFNKAKWRDEQIDSIIKEDMTVEELLKEEGTIIVDVRTIEEFEGGNVADSINIPLFELPDNLDKLKEMKYIIVCCASGNRSKQAKTYLQTQGIIATDGGAWTSVNYIKNNL
jgi:rhodanese-related sulfurtransferase